jgi:hypothetical protein
MEDYSATQVKQLAKALNQIELIKRRKKIKKSSIISLGQKNKIK